MKNNLVFGIIIGVILSFSLDIVAETMLTAEQVSYSNSKTSETTVKGNLDELFSAVDINERLGSTDISSIGDGTITGAISELNSYPDYENYISFENGDTMVEDGWVQIYQRAGTDRFMWVAVNGKKVERVFCPTSTNNSGIVSTSLIPVKKGDVVTYEHDATETGGTGTTYYSSHIFYPKR